MGRRRWTTISTLLVGGIGVRTGGVLLAVVSACAPGTTPIGRTGSGARWGLAAKSGRGAPWTIRCLELATPNRHGRIEEIAAVLRRTPGIKAGAVFVREADGVARLYYGTYYRRHSRAKGVYSTPREMTRDIELLRQLGLENGRRVFSQVLPVRMPVPDAGNPAWDLRRVEAMYTLQVAVFEPTDEIWDFKRLAADYCKLLRDMGYEAYYYHRPSASLVTVGRFGPDAVITQLHNGRYLTRYSREVQQLQEQELCRYNLLNGAIYRARSEDGGMVRVRSRLVEVPRGE